MVAMLCPHRNHMVSMWKPFDVHVKRMWFPYENHVMSTYEAMWCPPGNHMVSTWEWCGFHVVTILCPHRNHMVFTLKSCGDHMDTIWYPCGHNVVTMWTPHGFHVDTKTPSYVTSKNYQCLNACNFLNNGLIFNPQKVLKSSWSASRWHLWDFVRLHPKLHSHLKSKAVRTALLKIKRN